MNGATKQILRLTERKIVGKCFKPRFDVHQAHRMAKNTQIKHPEWSVSVIFCEICSAWHVKCEVCE